MTLSPLMQRLVLTGLLCLLSACVNPGIYNWPGRPAPAQTSQPSVVRSRPDTTNSSAETGIQRRDPVPSQQPAPRPENPIEREPIGPSAPAAVTPAPPPSTVAAPAATLLTSVDAAVAAGDLEGAAATAERALRISPRDAYLWYRLATIHYQQRQYTDAEGFARRALSFAGQDRQLTSEINELLTAIANIR